MNSALFCLLLLTSALPASPWALDRLDESWVLRGSVKPADGAVNGSLVFDGDSLLELKDSASLTAGTFSLSLWFNPYEPEGRQQMLVGKNRYSRDERQWGLLIEPDGRLKAYFQQDGWRTIECAQPLKPGAWHRAAVVVEPDRAALFLNGLPVGETKLARAVAATAAPITLGGIFDEGRVRQAFAGALDDLRIEPGALRAEDIASAYQPVMAMHELPEPKTVDYPLWDPARKLGRAGELPVLEGVEFHVIKKWDKPGDGYTFLHGVGLAWHKGLLYASIGHNQGDENTVTEEAQYRVSDDGGRSWGPLQVIDAGEEKDLAVSHGVFLSHAGRLWAFHGAYSNHMESIHTRAYSLDEATGRWVKHGTVLADGFWALNQPVKMTDGNWIMAGISAGPYSNSGVFPAAVAISHGDDFTRWDFVAIPVHDGLRLWGESAVIVDGPNVMNIARYGGRPLALAARSSDHGRTWSTMGESNLPMTTSKPAAGMLSTGQRYLVCTNAADNGGRRYPLTIAVSEPGREVFSRVFVIRHAEHGGPGESAPNASLSYPCAIEHEGCLYVGFSNNGGRRGNLNSAEMAVIPLGKLR